MDWILLKVEDEMAKLSKISLPGIQDKIEQAFLGLEIVHKTKKGQ
jgi:hypothetical protein